MTVDNIVKDWTIIEVDRNDPEKPYIVDIELKDPIEGLFVNDDIRWLNATWRVWAMEGDHLTIIRRA